MICIITIGGNINRSSTIKMSLYQYNSINSNIYTVLEIIYKHF